jgi:hypothetical protein
MQPPRRPYRMTNIDSTSRFLMGLQQQVSATVQRARVGKAAPARTGQKTGDTAVRDRQGLVLERIKAIPEDDPLRRRKAFRVYLESVLADELGMELLADPAYHGIVERVHAAMDGDSAIAASLEQAGDYLLRAARER